MSLIYRSKGYFPILGISHTTLVEFFNKRQLVYQHFSNYSWQIERNNAVSIWWTYRRGIFYYFCIRMVSYCFRGERILARVTNFLFYRGKLFHWASTCIYHSHTWELCDSKKRVFNLWCTGNAFGDATHVAENLSLTLLNVVLEEHRILLTFLFAKGKPVPSFAQHIAIDFT